MSKPTKYEVDRLIETLNTAKREAMSADNEIDSNPFYGVRMQNKISKICRELEELQNQLINKKDKART